jgi:ribonuclease HI
MGPDCGGTGAGVYRQSVDRRLSISLRKHATVFQAEVYAISACVHEIETQDRPEKYVSICSDSQAALKALQPAKTTSRLVQQRQKALNDISTRHTVGLYWVPGHARVGGNEIADKLAMGGFVQKFVGPEPFLGGLKAEHKKKD